MSIDLKVKKLKDECSLELSNNFFYNVFSSCEERINSNEEMCSEEKSGVIQIKDICLDKLNNVQLFKILSECNHYLSNNSAVDYLEENKDRIKSCILEFVENNVKENETFHINIDDFYQNLHQIFNKNFYLYKQFFPKNKKSFHYKIYNLHDELRNCGVIINNSYKPKEKSYSIIKINNKEIISERKIINHVSVLKKEGSLTKTNNSMTKTLFNKESYKLSLIKTILKILKENYPKYLISREIFEHKMFKEFELKDKICPRVITRFIMYFPEFIEIRSCKRVKGKIEFKVKNQTIEI